MKVLITGGAGYIGTNVVEELLIRGHKPVVFDTFYWGKESLEPYINKISLIEGDCRHSRDVIYALEGIDAEICPECGEDNAYYAQLDDVYEGCLITESEKDFDQAIYEFELELRCAELSDI